MPSSSRPPMVRCHGLRRAPRFIGFVLALSLLSAPAAAQTTSDYTGASGGPWGDPNSWTPARPPNNTPFETFNVNVGPNDYVFQDMDATINDLNFIRSTLEGPPGTKFNLTVEGNFYWEDVVLVGPGTTTVNGETTLVGFANTLNGRGLLLNGNSNLNADLTLSNNSVIENRGDLRFGIRTDLLGPNSTFVNNGRVLQAGTSNINQIESAWQQGPEGQLNLLRTFRLENDSTHSGGIMLGSSGALELRSNTISLPTVHTFNADSSMTGAGTILVQGSSATNKATAHFNGTINRSGIFMVRDGTANVTITDSTVLGNTIDLRPNGTFNVTLIDSGGDNVPVFNLPAIRTPSGGGAIFDLQAGPGLERPVQVHIPELNQSFGAGTYTANLPQGSSLTFENWEQFGRAILDVREAAQRSAVKNNLKAIGLALHSFAELQLGNGTALTIPEGGTASINAGSSNAPTSIGPADPLATDNLFFIEGLLRTLPRGSPGQLGSVVFDVPLEIGPAGQFDLSPAASSNLVTTAINSLDIQGAMTVGANNTVIVKEIGNLGDLTIGGTVGVQVQPGTTEITGESITLQNGTLSFRDASTQEEKANIERIGMIKAALAEIERGRMLQYDMDPFSAFAVITFGVDPTTLSPGESPGRLTVTADAVTLAPALTTQIELAGNQQGVSHDWLEIVGDLTLGGELELSLLDGYEQSIQSSDIFAIITADGIDGAFANVANGDRLFTADGLGSFLVHYGQGSAFNPNHVVLSSFLVPEPASVLWLGAAALLGMLRRRRRHMIE